MADCDVLSRLNTDAGAGDGTIRFSIVIFAGFFGVCHHKDALGAGNVSFAVRDFQTAVNNDVALCRHGQGRVHDLPAVSGLVRIHAAVFAGQADRAADGMEDSFLLIAVLANVNVAIGTDCRLAGIQQNLLRRQLTAAGYIGFGIHRQQRITALNRTDLQGRVFTHQVAEADVAACLHGQVALVHIPVKLTLYLTAVADDGRLGLIRGTVDDGNAIGDGDILCGMERQHVAVANFQLRGSESTAHRLNRCCTAAESSIALKPNIADCLNISRGVGKAHRSFHSQESARCTVAEDPDNAAGGSQIAAKGRIPRLAILSKRLKGGAGYRYILLEFQIAAGGEGRSGGICHLNGILDHNVLTCRQSQLTGIQIDGTLHQNGLCRVNCRLRIQQFNLADLRAAVTHIHIQHRAGGLGIIRQNNILGSHFRASVHGQSAVLCRIGGGYVAFDCDGAKQSCLHNGAVLGIQRTVHDNAAVTRSLGNRTAFRGYTPGINAGDLCVLANHAVLRADSAYHADIAGRCRLLHGSAFCGNAAADRNGSGFICQLSTTLDADASTDCFLAGNRIVSIAAVQSDIARY